MRRAIATVSMSGTLAHKLEAIAAARFDAIELFEADFINSGAGVHHIALRCDDIFESMTRLRANGVRFVPISGNYYDDLIARLGLDEALMRRMQSLDVLYDASVEGCFFHAYGEPFQERFFFEVVQRDRYDAYGALNAPARMASEAQRGDG